MGPTSGDPAVTDRETKRLRRTALACAVLAALAGGRADADIVGTIDGVDAPGTPIVGGDSVGLTGDFVGGFVDADGLAVNGVVSLTGSTVVASPLGSARLTVDEGQAQLRVLGPSGGENGIVAFGDATVLAGSGDTGSTLITLDQDGVAIGGTGTATGNLGVAGDLQVGGTFGASGPAILDGGLTATGDSLLQSADGTAFGGVGSGFAALQVQNGGGTLNGIAVDALSTTLSGGTGTTTVSIGDGGMAVDGALAGTGGATLTSSDGSASAGIADGMARLAVDNGAGGTNGVAATASELRLTGGGATGAGAEDPEDAAGALVTLTEAGLTLSDSDGSGGTGGNLTVLGATQTNGVANAGALASVGDATLVSSDGTAQVAVANGTASLQVQGAAGARYGIAVTSQGTVITGAGATAVRSPDGTAGMRVDDGQVVVGVANASGGTNGMVSDASSTTIVGGTGTTYLGVTDNGVSITGTGPSNGDLHVQGDVNVGGNLRVAPNRTLDFGGNRLQGVGEGVADTDAVNVGQLDDVQEEARRGVAIAAALDTLLPDPDKRFRLNLGGGYYNGESAIGLTGAGRVDRDLAVYFGIGSDSGFNETAGKIGVSYQW